MVWNYSKHTNCYSSRYRRYRKEKRNRKTVETMKYVLPEARHLLGEARKKIEIFVSKKLR